MPKTDETENEQIKQLLTQINQKIGSAKVLNGGFDRLAIEVSQIKEMQAKLNTDFESHKINDTRIEQKLDRLYDPEDGIYSKLHKQETMMTNLTEKVNSLAAFDKEVQDKVQKIDTRSDDTERKLKSIEKIAGEDNKELNKAVKISKGVWWFAGFAVTGLLSAIGKFLWDLFVG